MAFEGRKNLRQFQCADALWNTVRRMAAEQDKGVDELVTDALVAYAQLAGYQSSVSSEEMNEGPATPPYLVFDNQKYRIDKDQFIIGRGSKSSDLPIKDGNISRKHAAVIRRNGTYFIKDLGSTNGIDFKGMRIDNKRIDEGDVFHLCDYELRFTYKR
jgi:hypothetical protein